jgi:aryl-alcohol dehydrogenase-like predicted oxidoreductase
LRKLALGTVQFGLNYGVTNTNGKVKEAEVKEMLDLAAKNNINTIDTAIGYGDSEKILGKNKIESFDIITKIPPLQTNLNIRDWVTNQIQASLMRLNKHSIYAVLFHNPNDLLSSSGKKLYEAVSDQKKSGLVEKIGISIYSPDQLEKITKYFDYDIVQAPLNLIDRRLVESGWLSKLHKKNIEVHIRSVFLQGLLLQDRKKIPEKFKRWDSIWKVFDDHIKQNNINPVELCLSYPLNFSEVTKIVVGAHNTIQLKEIIDSYEYAKLKDFPNITSYDEDLINPGNWTLL